MKLFSVNTEVLPRVRLIGHVNYTKPWKHFRRISDEYIMYFIKRGELFMKEGDEKYKLKRGDVFLLEPNVLHEGYKESCCHYYYIHFKHDGISDLSGKTDNEIVEDLKMKRKLSLTSNIYNENMPMNSIYYFEKKFHYEKENELFSKLAEADYDFYQGFENYKVITSLKFSELIIGMCRQYTTKRLDSSGAHFSKSFKEIRCIINYIEKNYSKKITSNDIEDISEYNFNYIDRIFQKITGHTIFNYLNVIRIKKSQELIYSTSLKFSQIGYLVGIEDPYYFSKLFKKFTGMTASEYSKLRFAQR